MTPTEFTVAEKAKTGKTPPAAWVFLQRWLANPLAVGSVTPSGPGLKKLVCENLVLGPDQVVCEFGAGTGPITQALLDAGVASDRIHAFEIDRELSSYLHRHFPHVKVHHGDCRNVAETIGPELVGKVGTVIIGIPMISLPISLQQEIVDATFQVMPAGSRFLLYTYMLHSPLNQKALGLKGKRLGWTPKNIPPASVWGYWKA